MSAEHYIGFGNGGEYTKDGWSQSLRTGIGTYTFPGNIDRGATLLEEFSTGVTYVHDFYTDHGFQLPPPEIIIAIQENYINAPFACVTQDGVSRIFVDAKILEKYAQRNLDEEIVVQKNTPTSDTIIFEGSPRNLYAISGVEEAHHSIVNTLKPGLPQQASPDDIPSDEYDAQYQEWHGLRWQRRYAREKQMPYHTQTILRKRLQKAKIVRKMQRQMR